MKFCFNFSGNSSLAHKSIHHKNIASSFGYISFIFLSKDCLNIDISFLKDSFSIFSSTKFK
ncbi:MAG: hypothetical protein P1U46_01275 [Patescibacteria group bacterium]|nr:hypothetical protein [Patescibacteria group bacterium]